MTHIITPPARNATVRQAFASVHVAKIGRKQMTKSVWNQLPEYDFTMFVGGPDGSWSLPKGLELIGYPGRQISGLDLKFWGIVRDCKCRPNRDIEHIQDESAGE